MKLLHFIAGRPRAAIAVALFAAASLTACGGSTTHDNADTETPAPPTPAPVVDAFFAAVSSLVSAADAAEEVSIDAMAATSPEDTEPEPLG